MMVKSSNQLSPSGWLKRFPVPRNFNVKAKSRIGTGRESRWSLSIDDGHLETPGPAASMGRLYRHRDCS